MWQLLSIETNIYPQLPASCLRCRLLLLITALALLLQCKGRFSAALPVPSTTSVLALLFLAPPVHASPSFWKASSACVRSSYTPPDPASPAATSPSIADSPPAAARASSSPAGPACAAVIRAAVARATAAAAAPAAVPVRAVGLRVSSACGEVVFGEAGGSAAVVALSDAQGLRLFDRDRVGLFRNRSGCATPIDSSTTPDDISRGILLSSSSISGGRRTPSKRSKGSNSCSRYCSSKRSFTRCSRCVAPDPSLVQIVEIASAAVPCDAQITPKPSSLRASALAAAGAWKAAAGFAAAVTENKRAKCCRCCCLLKNIDGTAGVLLTHEGRLRDGAAAGKGSHHLHRQASWQLTRKKAQSSTAASQAESPAAATAAAKPLPIAAQVVATVPPTARPIAVTPLTAAGTANVSSPPAAALSAATQTTASCLPPAAATSSAAAVAVTATPPSATAAQSGLARLPQKWFTRTTDHSSLVRPSLRRSSSSLTSLPLLLLQLPLRVARVRLTLTPTAAARPSAEAADEVDAAEAAAKTPRAVAQSLRLLLSRSLLLRVPVLLSTGALLLVLLLLQIRYACSARSGKTCTSRSISSTPSSKCNGASPACAAVRAIAAVTLAEEVLCTLQGQIEQLKYEARTLSIPSEYLPLSSSNGSQTEKANSSGNSNTYRGSSSINADDSSRSADSSIWNYGCSGDLCRHPCRTGEFQSSSQGNRTARAYCSNYCPPERQLPRAATWAITQWENENGDNERKNEHLSFYAHAAAAYVNRFLELWHQAQHLLQGGLPQRQQQKRQLQQKQQRNLQVGALEFQQQEGQDRREGIRRSGKSINGEKGKQQPQRQSEERQQRQPQRHLAQKEDSRPWELAETQSRAAGDGVEFVKVDGVRCCCSRWCSAMEESSNFYKDSLSCTSSLSRRNSSSDSINGGTSNNSNGRSDSEHAKLRWSAVAECRGRVAAAVYCPVAALARQQLQEKFYSLAADIYRGVLQRLHQELVHKFSKEFACLVGGMPAFDREACRLRCTYTTLHREACAAAALHVKPVIGHRLLQSCSRHVATATTGNTDHPCSDRWCSSSRCWWRSRNGWRFWWSCCSPSSTIRNSSNGICMECVNQEFSEALQRLIEERSMEGVALKEAAAAVESLQAWKVVQHVAQVTAVRLLPLVLQFVVRQLQQKYTAGALSAGRRSLVRRRTAAQ